MHGTIAPAWFPDWRGEVCAIVASGESVSQEIVEQVRGRCRVIVVNNNFQIAPWADVLYACDGTWWQKYPDALQFAGLKVTQDFAAAKHHKLNLVKLLDEKPEQSRISVATKGVLARGGNGGFQAINLAVQFGATKQIWLGFDFCGEHWHGKHEGLLNPRPKTMERWAETLDAQAPILASLGVEVVNCSEISILRGYPKVSVAEALAKFCRDEEMANEDDDRIDFDAAERYLRAAREAHEVGDHVEFVAARKLVAVALHLIESPAPRSQLR